MSITVKRFGGCQCEKKADAAALARVFGVSDCRLRFRELEPLSNRFARLLLDAGCMRGDRVCLLLDNPVNMLVCMAGIIKIGAFIIPLSPVVSATRFEWILHRENISWIIADTILSSPLILTLEAYQVEGNRLGFGWLGDTDEIRGLYMSPEFISGNLVNYSDDPFPLATVGSTSVHIDYNLKGTEKKRTNLT